MTESFLETVFGLMELLWQMVMLFFIALLLPIWFIPFTVFKLWQQIKFKNKEPL